MSRIKCTTLAPGGRFVKRFVNRPNAPIVLAKGCPIAIAQPRRRAMRSASASLYSTVAGSIGSSKNTSRVRQFSPSWRATRQATDRGVVRESTKGSRWRRSAPKRPFRAIALAVKAEPMWLFTATAPGTRASEASKTGAMGRSKVPTKGSSEISSRSRGSSGRCNIGRRPAARSSAKDGPVCGACGSTEKVNGKGSSSSCRSAGMSRPMSSMISTRQGVLGLQVVSLEARRAIRRAVSPAVAGAGRGQLASTTTSASDKTPASPHRASSAVRHGKIRRLCSDTSLP